MRISSPEAAHYNISNVYDPLVILDIETEKLEATISVKQLNYSSLIVSSFSWKETIFHKALSILEKYGKKVILVNKVLAKEIDLAFKVTRRT